MEKLKVLSVVLGIIILSNCTNSIKYKEGLSPCIETQIDFNNKNDQLIIYNDYFIYRFNESEFKVEPDIYNVKKDSIFYIIINKNVEGLKTIANARITIQVDRRIYIGHGILPHFSLFPPISDFYIIWDEAGMINLMDQGKKIGCIRSEFLTVEEYQKKILGVDE